MEGLGLSGATRRVAEHAREFVRLEIELATAELKKKAAALGTGLGLMAGAAVLAFLALTFGLLAAAAGLATTLSVWASLLIVCGGLVLITAILVFVGYRLLQKGAKPMPEQAVEEARLAGEALRNGDRA
ncbi:MAG TPA: phage holin family protein [Gaiellaceae bacterium]|jgi:membrane protein implicated in regulation of membrane protease activity